MKLGIIYMVLVILLGLLFLAVRPGSQQKKTALRDKQIVIRDSNVVSGVVRPNVETGKTSPTKLVSYAKTLLGTPYLYASANPVAGFDCSGFITWVFNHFNIKVPRSSVEFTNVGKEIPIETAQAGDIILFTGTDSTKRVVGHMGIITSNPDEALEFIHSTSGKAKGVVVTPFENYYRSRFVKVIRVFDDDFFKAD